MGCRLFLLAGAIMASMTGAACAQDKIAIIAGLQTQVIRNGQSLRARDGIFVGDTLRTNATGISQFQFRDRSTAKLGPNSQVEFTEEIANLANRKSSIAMRMAKGVARFVGSDASKSQPIMIATPNMALGVLGGIVEITVENGQTQAALTSGKMVCAVGGSQKIVRRSGFSCIVGPDGALSLRKTPRSFARVLDTTAIPNASNASNGDALIGILDDLPLQCGVGQSARSGHCNAQNGGYPFKGDTTLTDEEEFEPDTLPDCPPGYYRPRSFAPAAVMTPTGIPPGCFII